MIIKIWLLQRCLGWLDPTAWWETSKTSKSCYQIGVITKSSNDTSSRYLLNSHIRSKEKANLMCKCINNLAPAYLCNLFAPKTSQRQEKKLMLPKWRTYYMYLKRSLSYNGSLLWNNLPEEIRTLNSLGLF